MISTLLIILLPSLLTVTEVSFHGVKCPAEEPHVAGDWPVRTRAQRAVTELRSGSPPAGKPWKD